MCSLQPLPSPILVTEQMEQARELPGAAVCFFQSEGLWLHP